MSHIGYNASVDNKHNTKKKKKKKKVLPPPKTTHPSWTSPGVFLHPITTGRCLPYLATMSALRILHIYIASEDLATFLSTDSHERDFQNLTDVSLISNDSRRCFELLRRPGFQNLHSPEIVCSTLRIEDWDFNSFCKTLQDTQASNTLLRTFRISIEYWGCSPGIVPFPSRRELYGITPTTLKPLLRFIKLEHILLDLGGGVEIDDETLYDASKAWPKLKTLALPERRRFTDPEITFSGLTHLAKFCPILETVSLRINGLSGCDIPNQRAGENLTSLNICIFPLDSD